MRGISCWEWRRWAGRSCYSSDAASVVIPVTISAIAIGGDNLDHDIALLQFLAFLFPISDGTTVAIDPQSPPACAQAGDGLAAFLLFHHAFYQLDTPRDRGEVGKVIGDM